jgi:alkylation response protein AidB-like acyl-CoA dehydrogenase
MRSALGALVDEWRSQRSARFGRRQLDRADFERMGAIGVPMLPVPEDRGGAWRTPATSVRPIGDALRILAGGDPSTALVAAMHPAVLAFWLVNRAVGCDAWERQRHDVFGTAADGAQWGTVTSEPGSGGDVTRTRATAVEFDGLDDLPVSGRRFLVTGDKHFGSGTGVCSYMLTTAIPEHETEPAAFFLDTRALAVGRPQPGFTIVKEWDGVGMAASQSHAVRLEDCPAVRLEWPDTLEAMTRAAGPINMCLFTAVVIGVLDEAIATAEQRVGSRFAELRPFEQVEWVNATTDHWLAVQAYDAMIRAVESDDPASARRACLRGKIAVSELAERAMLRTTRVVGGGSFSAASPFASWFQDVRALGFLRPPWGLAVDGLIAAESAAADAPG